MQIGQLIELARLLSIQVSYDDAAGKQRRANREAILRAISMRIGNQDPAEALQERQERFWKRGIEPVTVVWGERRPLLDLRLARHEADVEADWTVDFEGGDSREGTIDLAAEDEGIDRGRFVGKTIRLPIALPEGYHRFRIRVGRRTLETLIIAAPRQCYPIRQRSWGVFAPVYAMRAGRELGAGDIASLREYRQWLNDRGGSVLATLPMPAAFDDEPSPYSPVSRLFWNEMYLDLHALPEFLESDLGRNERRLADEAATVEYAKVRARRRKIVERCAARFASDPEFEEFARHAAPYAAFRARHERGDSQTDEVPSVADLMADGRSRYHLYAQYRMAQQMRDAADEARRGGVGLYLDYPIGVNAGGYDAWRYRKLFAHGVSVGSPPDLFFTKGQNWGFPPLDPDAVREDHYRYFAATIRHHVAHAGILRIDHVMGLHRLFWIPEGSEAADGVYVRYPEEELYAVLALESQRHRCAVVGEDLGTVPSYVPRVMEKHGLRRMFVVQYEIKPDADMPLGEAPAAAIASVNTHDMPSFAGFWAGRDIEDRVSQRLLDAEGAAKEQESRALMRDGISTFITRAGLRHGDPEDRLQVLESLLAHLAAGPAEIVLANIEDLWLEEKPQNVPGVPDRSWRQRFRLSLDQVRNDPDITRILETIDTYRRKIHGIEAQQGQQDRNTAARRRPDFGEEARDENEAR